MRERVSNYTRADLTTEAPSTLTTIQLHGDQVERFDWGQRYCLGSPSLLLARP